MCKFSGIKFNIKIMFYIFKTDKMIDFCYCDLKREKNSSVVQIFFYHNIFYYKLHT